MHHLRTRNDKSRLTSKNRKVVHKGGTGQWSTTENYAIIILQQVPFTRNGTPYTL
jgi:hypothetical protein